ncbi:MAG: AraC family transcriptional regulator [Puniceicoccaceae bacterium]
MVEQKTEPVFLSSQVNESDYFFLNLKAGPGHSFTVACGGLEVCNLHYTVDRQRFDYYGMEYIVSGSGQLTLEGKTYPLNAGSIFCYGPRTQHRIENTGNSSLVKFFVDFSGTQAREVVEKPFFKPLGPRQMPNLRTMHELFLQILETGKQGGQGCQRILHHLVELVAMQATHRAVGLQEYASQTYATYEHCRIILERRFTQLSSISQWALEAGISTGYLSRIIRKYSEESPLQMLLRLKMNRAGELLLQEDLLIKQVADAIGYEDPYHFSRLFKQFFGLSPKHFRESVKRSGLSH